MLWLANNRARGRKLVGILGGDALKGWAVYSIKGVVLMLLGAGAIGVAGAVHQLALWLFN